MLKKKSVRSKIVTGFLLFEILLVIYSALMVGMSFYNFRMKEYKETIYEYLKSASAYIDGDRILNYLETGEPDDYYYNVLNYLDTTRIGTDIETFCIFVPYENDLAYIWMSADDQNSLDWLNKHEKYMASGKDTRDATFRKDPVEFVSKYSYEGQTILAGFYPIFSSDGDPVALIDIDISYQSTMKSILIGIISFILGVLFITFVVGWILFTYFKSILIRPIKKLNTQAKNMLNSIDKDEELVSAIHTGDELEELSDSFVQMGNDIKKYINENVAMAAENERIETELEFASKVQIGMLPKIESIEDKLKGNGLYATMTPAREVGGDFYDYYMTDNGRLVILIADVSDKGAGAALFMAISKSLLKSRAAQGDSAESIITHVDNMIASSNKESMFVTVWLAIIDLETGHVDVCNAGHDYPAIMKQDEDFVIEKTVHGPPIGFIPGAKFVSYEIQLQPGDRIFLYTDGVNEAKRPDGERFGLDRLVEVLNANKETSDRDLIKNVKDAVWEFAGEEPQFDDMTMLSFTFKGNVNTNDEV